MKKIAIGFVVVILGLFIISGCDSSDLLSKYDTSKYNLLTCSIDAEDENVDNIDISYRVYYDDKDNVQILYSDTVVEAANVKELDEYEKSYRNIYKAYDNLKYYDYHIKRENGKIEVVALIDYGNIDINELISIEGSEDNVLPVNGKIRLKDWKAHAEKYGATCKM